MRTILICVTALFASLATLKAQEPAIITDSRMPELKQGLVAWYPFIGNSYKNPDSHDWSGNGYHGVAYNTKSVRGIQGRALSLDKKETGAAVCGEFSIPQNVMRGFRTFAFYFKVSQIDPENRDWMKNGLFWDNGNNSLDSEFGIHLHDRDTISIGWGNAANHHLLLYKGIKINQWHHVAVVIGERKTSLYIDGEMAKERKTDSSLLKYGLTRENPHHIDRHVPQFGGHPDSSKPYDGKQEKHYDSQQSRLNSHAVIDEVRIYNRPLSADEIKRLAIYLK